MLLHVWPSLNFWFYLAIISSPSWVFSFLTMDFIKKTSGLVFIFLILTLTLSCFASNLLLSKLYFSLRRNPKTNRFFRGYECAGKTTGFVLVVLGSVGLSYFSEKSVACVLTFLFLAFYCLCALFCIQPYTSFGALEFLLTSSLNPTLRRFGLLSVYSWLVIITCIVIFGIRYRLQPKHPHEQATGDEVEVEVQLDLEAGRSFGIRNRLQPKHPHEQATGDEVEVQLEAGVSLDNINPSPSDIFLEPAPAGGPTTPLLEEDQDQSYDHFDDHTPASQSMVEDLVKTAGLYYDVISSSEVKEDARKFFEALDDDKDGQVSIHELLRFMRQHGHAKMSNRHFFKQIDRHGNGRLGFKEVMAVYYIIKSGRPFCNGCGEFIPGMYFTCSECFGNGSNLFYVCPTCLEYGGYVHVHNKFMDNYALLEAKRLQGNATFSSEHQPSSSVTIEKC